MPLWRMHDWSIRTRIALTIFAVATAALVIMALAVFFTFRKVLLDNFDDTLRQRAGANLSLVDLSQDVPRLRLTLPPRAQSNDGESFVRLYSTGGDLLAADARSSGPLDAERMLLAQALRGGEAGAVLRYDRTSFGVLALPVIRSGAVVAVLLTGLQRDAVAEPLDILQVILLIAVPLTSGALAAGAFVIARRALQPVHEITATARSITAGDLRQRIVGVTSRDEVGELAATFNTMIGRLAETIERERRFTGDASHELRTPLTAMETAIEVTLSQQRTLAEYHAVLLALRAQTGRLTRMARQLLTLSRLDADSVRLEFVPVIVSELLEAVLDAFADRHPDVPLASRFSAPSSAIDADPEMLARAFTNVLENATVHGGPGVGITVELSVRAHQAVVTITDTGSGIPAELLPTIFQRFRRGDASRSRGGTGLGLAIVESITRLHHGSVTIDSSSRGTTVRFAFPLARAA